MKKAKLLMIGAVCITMVGILAFGRVNNQTISNPVSTYDRLENLVSDVSFKFSVPEILTQLDNISFTNLQNRMVILKGNDIEFRAAPFMDTAIEVSGDYNKYTVDTKYDISGDTVLKYLRIRGEGVMDDLNFAIVSYSTEDTAYSLSINRETNQSEILNILGLDIDDLTERDTETVEEVGENSIIHEYKLNNLGYTIELPTVESDIRVVEDASDYKYATFMLLGKAILSIEENNDIEYNTSNTTQVGLIDNYILKYTKQNPFEVGTVEYDSFNKIMESINTVALSFKLLE